MPRTLFFALETARGPATAAERVKACLQIMVAGQGFASASRPCAIAGERVSAPVISPCAARGLADLRGARSQEGVFSAPGEGVRGAQCSSRALKGMRRVGCFGGADFGAPAAPINGHLSS